MKLWTIQPENVFNELQSTGLYRCDINKSFMKEYALVQYDWLVMQMRKRLGNPPEGVNYPVWAWKKWRFDHDMPDLRAERWYYGAKGEKFFRLEIEISDSQVLLSDFDAWSVMLNEGLLSYSEHEDSELEKIYNALSDDEKIIFRSKNWERVFDITPFNNEWMCRGESIQATFWELRIEQVKKVKMFISVSNH